MEVKRIDRNRGREREEEKEVDRLRGERKTRVEDKVIKKQPYQEAWGQ